MSSYCNFYLLLFIFCLVMFFLYLSGDYSDRTENRAEHENYGKQQIEPYDYSLDHAIEVNNMSDFQKTHGFSMYDTIYSATW
jgi:hypothetical protein